MDLSDLTRPAILCQCLRCSSSLAVLENEWGKLSSVYAVATAWLSVNLQRISISSEQKYIPQTSEMNLVRGRNAQEVSCKLCQQKLAVLCGLDNGPNILWKMSKVSFREIVTMRTADPLFKDGALDKVLPPPPPEPPRRSAQDNALVPSGAQDLFSLDPAMHQQMQHQGRSIDQISNSVNHLQDTMADLKHSFTSLRIELNGPTRSISDHGSMSDPGFDMIATVLKELKSKSDEIEKLKLEIEALKLKNRFMEERKPSSPEYSSQMNGRIADVQSPGLLQAGRKRGWPDAFSTGPPLAIADSFDEEDMVDDLSLENLPTYNVRVPPRQPARQLPSGPAQLRIEARQNDSTPTSTPPASHPEQNVAKRPRLTQTKDSKMNSEKPRGRPRKSNVAEPQEEPTAASTSQNPAIQVPIAPSSPEPQTTKRRRLRRSTRSQSFGPTSKRAQVEAGEAPAQEPSSKNDAESNGNGDAQQNLESSSVPAKGSAKTGAKAAEEARVTEEEKRKAKIAARDAMTRRAMEQEEQMETDGFR